MAQQRIEEELSRSMRDLVQKVNDQINELKSILEIKEKLTIKDFEKEEDYYKNYREIQNIEDIISIPSLLKFEEERKLFMKHMMIVSGEAGVGKSQGFANAAKQCLNEEIPVLLMLGGTFQNLNMVSKQIPDIIELKYDLDSIFSAMERAAIEKEKQAIIFIDAINESEQKIIWKNGLVSLYNSLEKYPHIRIAISYRKGYENTLFDDILITLMKSQTITVVNHEGFSENPYNAMRSFLDFYAIPFSPSFILQYEMKNPLFLSLFCKSYSGGNQECDIFSVFEAIIHQADMETQKVLGFDGSENVLMTFLQEIRNNKGIN